MSQEPVTYPSHTAPRKRNWGRLASIGAILLFVLGKLKILIPAFKFLKFGSLLTMVASVWA